MDYDDDSDNEAEDAVQHHSHIAGPLVSRDGCTVSRFNAWLVRDLNRQQAVGVREEATSLRERHEKATASYVERRRLRTQSLRQQHTLAGQAVQEVKQQQMHKGASHRSVRDEHRQALKDRAAAFLDAQKTGSIKRHGEEQRKRTIGARSEIFEKRAAAALRARAEERARVDAARGVLQREAEAKKAACQQTRKDLSLAGLQGGGLTVEAAMGREHVLRQRREAAQAVRVAVQDWERQRQKEAKAAVKTVKQQHTDVLSTRHRAAERRAASADARRRYAQGLRADVIRWEDDRRTTVLATAATAKAEAQNRYDRRFVADSLAERVATSVVGSQDLTISSVASPSASRAGHNGGVEGDEEDGEDEGALES